MIYPVMPTVNIFTKFKKKSCTLFLQTGASAMDTSRTSMIKFSASSSDGGNENSKKLYCSRQLLRITECMNTSVLDCAVTFTCDKNVCVYGIQVLKIYNCKIKKKLSC